MADLAEKTFENISRAELAEMSVRHADMLYGSASRDASFIKAYYTLVPKVPALLEAVQRDASGHAGYACDLHTVLNVIEGTPQLKEMIRATGVTNDELTKSMRRAAHALSCGEYKTATTHICDLLKSLAAACTSINANDLAATFLDFADKIEDALTKEKKTIFSTAEASWWGSDMCILWSEDYSHIVRIEPSGLYTIFDDLAA